MKVLNFIISLILSLFCALCPTTIALAESEQTFATGKTEDVYIFSRPDNLSALFIIPYTYCVEILGERGDYYYVKYADDVGDYISVFGYCLKNSLTILKDVPETTFLQMSVPVCFSQENENSSLPVLDQITVQACFYGAYVSGGAEYSYVSYAGQFGYISGCKDYPLNDLYAQKEVVAPTQDGGLTSKITTAVCLATLTTIAFVLLVLTGKKQTKAKAR